MIGSIPPKRRLALRRCGELILRTWRIGAVSRTRLAAIARFAPFAISTGLSAAILATMYLAGLFFGNSPEPEKIRLARSCTPDAAPPSFLTILPAETVVIYPHGLALNGKPAAGKCSAVAICAPHGNMRTGGSISSLYKAHPETDREMCWAFATAPENVPRGADRRL